MKKTIAIFMAVLMLLTVFSITSFAAENEVIASGTCFGGNSWVLDAEKTLTISGAGRIGYLDSNTDEHDISDDIPLDIRVQAKKVVIEDGITELGVFALEFCVDAEEIILPSTLTKIYREAFLLCYRLKEIVIPEGVTYLGYNAFEFCWDLQTAVLPSTLVSMKETLDESFDCDYCYNAFADTPNLKTVVICNPEFEIIDNIDNTEICGMKFGYTDTVMKESIPEDEYSAALDALTEQLQTSDISNYCLNDIDLDAFPFDFNYSGEPHEIQGFTLVSSKGSTAEAYAEKNGFNFVEFKDYIVDKYDKISSFMENVQIGDDVFISFTQDGILDIHGTGASWTDTDWESLTEEQCKTIDFEIELFVYHIESCGNLVNEFRIGAEITDLTSVSEFLGGLLCYCPNVEKITVESDSVNISEILLYKTGEESFWNPQPIFNPAISEDEQAEYIKYLRACYLCEIDIWKEDYEDIPEWDLYIADALESYYEQLEEELSEKYGEVLVDDYTVRVGLTVCGYKNAEDAVDSLNAYAAENLGLENPIKYIKLCKHTNTELVNAVLATSESDGYTGDIVCVECGKILEKGESIKYETPIEETNFFQKIINVFRNIIEFIKSFFSK